MYRSAFISSIALYMNKMNRTSDNVHLCFTSLLTPSSLFLLCMIYVLHVCIKLAFDLCILFLLLLFQIICPSYRVFLLCLPTLCTFPFIGYFLSLPVIINIQDICKNLWLFCPSSLSNSSSFKIDFGFLVASIKMSIKICNMLSKLLKNVYIPLLLLFLEKETL